MKGDVLSQSDLGAFAEFSIVLFVFVFLVTLFWIFRPGSRRFYTERSGMPLDEEPCSTLSATQTTERASP